MQLLHSPLLAQNPFAAQEIQLCMQKTQEAFASR
jgi:hypothetical protein